MSAVLPWVVMRPTTAEVRDPWTPSIRLSAPALASDTRTALAREWKHANGKCIYVRHTLEVYRIRHSLVLFLTCCCSEIVSTWQQ